MSVVGEAGMAVVGEAGMTLVGEAGMTLVGEAGIVHIPWGTKRMKAPPSAWFRREPAPALSWE